MATKKAVKKGAAVDVKALSAELGATIKEGRVSAARGKYFVTLGVKKVEIPVGPIASEGELKKLVGRGVGVLVSKGSVIAIRNPVGPGCYWIVCYKPAPGLLQAIQEDLREQALQEFVKAGAISESQAQQLAARE